MHARRHAAPLATWYQIDSLFLDQDFPQAGGRDGWARVFETCFRDLENVKAEDCTVVARKAIKKRLLGALGDKYAQFLVPTGMAQLDTNCLKALASLLTVGMTVGKTRLVAFCDEYARFLVPPGLA